MKIHASHVKGHTDDSRLTALCSVSNVNIESRPSGCLLGCVAFIEDWTDIDVGNDGSC